MPVAELVRNECLQAQLLFTFQKGSNIALLRKAITTHGRFQGKWCYPAALLAEETRFRSSNPLTPPRLINILQRNHLHLPLLLQGGDAFDGGAGAGQGGDGGDGVIEGGAA